MEEADDRVVAAAGGDPQALEGLLVAAAPKVRERLQIGPIWQALIDVDDVMQVTLLEACLRFHSFRGRTQPALVAWLTQIAMNNLRDAIRKFETAKRGGEARRQGRSLDESSAILLDTLAAETETPSRQLAGREQRQRVLAAVADLPDAYRQVVQLYDLEGRQTEEVAQTMGRSPGAVYMLRARAHDRLRELLEQGT